jgi:cardiolipin synthase
LDGFLARRFSMRTELGAFLDPLADKALMATVYLSSAAAGATPWGLTALVVGRDLLIVAAIAALWAAGRRVAFRPLAISKANTAAQILYAAGALAVCAFGASAGLVGAIATIAMGALTVLSFLAYLVQWSRGEADAA